MPCIYCKVFRSLNKFSQVILEYEYVFYSVGKYLDAFSFLNRGCSKKTIVLFVVTDPMLSTEDFFILCIFIHMHIGI